MEKTTNNYFFIKQLMIEYGLIFLGILVSCIFTWSKLSCNFVFAFIIYLPFPLILYFISKKNIDAIIMLSKNGIKKAGVVTVSVFLFLFKYLIVIIPIILYVIIEVIYMQNIFNLFSIIITTMIYPLSSFISAIFNKK